MVDRAARDIANFFGVYVFPDEDGTGASASAAAAEAAANFLSGADVPFPIDKDAWNSLDGAIALVVAIVLIGLVWRAWQAILSIVGYLAKCAIGWMLVSVALKALASSELWTEHLRSTFAGSLAEELFGESAIVGWLAMRSPFDVLLGFLWAAMP